MSALKSPQQQTKSRKKELREERLVTLYAKAWMFFEENRKLVYGVLAGLVVLVAAMVGYLFYLNQQQAEAERLLARIVRTYEQGSYQQALDGTDATPGLLAISEDYGNTQAGNLATYYAADALYRLGEYDRALDLFQEFEKSEDFIGASALAAQASIHEARGEFSQAANLYRRAADRYPNSLTSPKYLLEAGQAFEEAGNFEAAMNMYERVQEEYPDADEAQDITRYIARARAKQRRQS